MGGVFFRRRLRPRVEIINDRSRDVANFFRILQRHKAALLEEMRHQVMDRAEFERLQRVVPDTLTDVERAARFYLLQRWSYAYKAIGQNFAVSGQARFDVRVPGRVLERIHGRLSAVIVECLPWADFVERYDRADALFYLDPLYYGCEDDYGRDMLARSDFDRMSGVLAQRKGRFLLSSNDAPEVRRIFAGFANDAVKTKYTVGNADRSEAAAEVLIPDGLRPGDATVERLDLL